MAAHVARGVRGVKMKVGGTHGVDEDLRRARSVREAIGPEVALMVDANMGWDVHEAVRAGRALVAPDIDALWLEEPTLPEDLDGMARVRALGGGVALAMGENLHTLYEFGAALRRGVVDFPQVLTYLLTCAFSFFFLQLYSRLTPPLVSLSLLYLRRWRRGLPAAGRLEHRRGDGLDEGRGAGAGAQPAVLLARNAGAPRKPRQRRAKWGLDGDPFVPHRRVHNEAAGARRGWKSRRA